MLFDDVKIFLKESSEKSDFKINIEKDGGYLVFSNSGQRGGRNFFTLSLSSIKNMLEDIKNNILRFKEHSEYIEKDWRDLSEYYTDKTAKSMARVQTKPLFVTLSKIISWANSEDNLNENIIDLSEKALENTINKLEDLLLNSIPNVDKKNIEELFSKWLKENIDTKAPIGSYSSALKEKIPKYLSKLGEVEYKNLFECQDINYLKTLYKRLLKGGDLHDFNISTQSRLPSASVGKYIDFLYEEVSTKNLEYANNLNILDNTKRGNLDFPHKNLLLKGVPGTGKSYTLDKIIKDDLKLIEKEHKNNILRINIHSASSNADLMQGIGINSKEDGNIEYKEKQGLIYNHIKKALFAPNQPFILVLEEIQENSLNELIGDLIYLIEDKKRVTVDDSEFDDGKEYAYQEFIDEVLKDEDNKHYIEIPFLVDTSTAYRKMVLPSNLYIFCTSNYRDDKKVIEDNLLRRFDVVEIYPQTQEQLDKDIFKSKDISDFLERLNKSILDKFKEEIHPDRYVIGHANWLDITEVDTEDDKKLFHTALLKVIIEFKEIREVDFDTYSKEILKNVLEDKSLSDRLKAYIKECSFEYKSYKEMVEKLQKKIYSFVK